MMAVAVRSHGNSEIDYSKPELLFETGTSDTGLESYVGCNSRRQPFSDCRTRQRRGRNWTDELKRLVPVSTK